VADAATITDVREGRAARVPQADSLPPAREEFFNALTHGAGCALSIVAATALLTAASRHGSAWEFGACVVYAVTLVAAYAASTLSHVFRSPAARNAFRIADQALIFLFIAGSWTPIAAAWLRTGRGWWVFHAAVWVVALAGFVSKALFAHRVTMGTVSALLYLLLGWSPVLVAVPLTRVLPAALCLWLLAGGICYTLGLLFFRYDDRVPYFHAAWHVFVIAGSACHYFGILNHCTGAR
jgi:hemolysin III